MKKEKHIQVKDNGIKLSNKVGDQLSDIKNTLENKIASDLTKGTELTKLQYQIKQNNQIRAFKEESKQLIRQTRKNLAKELKTDKSVNLTKEQVQSITKEIDKGLLFLRNNAQRTYQNIVTKTMVELRSKPALELSDALSKHLEKGLNIGVVYKDGKHFKFDSYYEMKARTDIQQDIGKNMVQAGHENGVIFYIASFYGDCAKDHVEYQGKIYVDENWEANAPEDRKEEIREYINQNKTMTVQAVMAGPAYLSTRPNCRHYFQYIDIDSVLGTKTPDDLNKLRNELNLNFNGKYQPEKYEALQKQRLNERKIRAEKQEIEKQEQLLHLNPGDKTIQSRILMGENNVRRYQAEQRELIKEFNNLERRYDREALGNRVTLGIDEHGNEPKQYLMKPTHIGINETELEKESGIKKPSNLFAWRITKTGDIHALKSHKEVPERVPDWKEKTIEAISNGNPKRDLKRPNENVVIYKLPIDDGHFFHVSVLIDKKINYVKSISYRSYKIKKTK